MARIRVAETTEWTEALTAVLHAAGHEVTDERAEVEFIDAVSPLGGREEVLTLIVAGMDQVPQALDLCKQGAYAFVRYPFVADEVTLLVERAVDHQALAHEAHDLRQQLKGRPHRLAEQIADADATDGAATDGAAIPAHDQPLSQPAAATAAGATATAATAGAFAGHDGNVVATVARNLAGKPLADIEKQVILSTLEQFKGHRVRTATALGIGVRTLGMKLKRWREEGEPIVSRSTSPAGAQSHRPEPANT